MVANDNLVTTMPVAPANGGFGGGFGGDWGWIILLLLFAGRGWGNNGGFGGGYDFPWLMNGQQDIMMTARKDPAVTIPEEDVAPVLSVILWDVIQVAVMQWTIIEIN